MIPTPRSVRRPRRTARRGADTSTSRPARTAISAILAGLIALDVLVYWPVRTFGLVNWDDPVYLTDNVNVAHGLTWTSIKWALITGHAPYWHP